MRRVSSLVLILLILVVGLPILWVFVGSLKTSGEIVAQPWGLPHSPQWSNYPRAWTEEGLGTGFINSFLACGFTLLVLLPVGAMAAYILARYPFRGSKTLFGVFLGGMMFPNFLLVIPLFLLMTQLNLTNSMPGLVLAYVAYSLSFTIFVLTGFFQALPAELHEAAILDGCGHTTVFTRIMLPLVKPGLIVVGIFNAIGLWNEYPLAMILMTDKEQRTLPLKIADMALALQYKTDYGHLFAGLVIVMLPVMIVFWVLREKIQEAMVAGAVKG